MPEIGQTLREARMRQKIDMTEVEAATKIRAKYLRALENEEWDLLPGPTFVKTFLRTYAEYLGLDARMLVEEYRQRFERPSTQDLTPFAPGLGGTRNRRRMRPLVPVPVLLGVVGVVVLLGALYLLGTWGNGGGGGAETVAPSPTPRQGGADAGSDSGSSQRRRKRSTRRRGASSRTVRLSVVPTGEVFVCLVDASGKRLVAGQNLAAGDRKGPYSSRRFRVTLGNGQVSLRIDGKPVSVPSLGEPVGYEITSGKRRRLSAAQRPTCA